MSHIVTILRAAHCRSTHHYFAIDALGHVDTVQGKRLANLLLKYHDDYLIGAKAPDKTFRDFQNHVLHVEDNYWGGAPRLCAEWAEKVQENLDRRQWRKAAYACGVLSHYFTDPLMPLHTGQTEREGIVHRPMEWSICKSYDAIHSLIATEKIETHFQLESGADWLQKAVTEGAIAAHRHYDRLIEIYDMQNGCKNPPKGLNAEARSRLAELFGLATVGWAGILSRLADDTTSNLPDVSLGLTTLLASLDMPLAWIVRKISSVQEQRAVQRIFTEFVATGTVRRNLPSESKVVRRELNAHRAAMPENTTPRHPLKGKPQQSDRRLEQLSAAQIPKSVSPPDANDRLETKGRTSTLSLTSDLVDAPSIGPKTARRFAKIGITTVGDFIAANRGEMVTQLATRWISEELLHDWQDQAQLVCDVNTLCGYKAQLLVGIGCRSSAELVSGNVVLIHQQIQEFVQTNEGARILRSSRVPSETEIARWIESAGGNRNVQAA